MSRWVRVCVSAVSVSFLRLPPALSSSSFLSLSSSLRCLHPSTLAVLFVSFVVTSLCYLPRIVPSPCWFHRIDCVVFFFFFVIIIVCSSLPSDLVLLRVGCGVTVVKEGDVVCTKAPPQCCVACLLLFLSDSFCSTCFFFFFFFFSVSCFTRKWSACFVSPCLSCVGIFAPCHTDSPARHKLFVHHCCYSNCRTAFPTS